MDRIIAILGAAGIGYFSLWFLKYAFYMLTQTAEGHAEVPLFTDNLIRPFEDFRPIKLIVIIVSHITILGNIIAFNTTLGYLYSLVILFFFPAIISELAMENNFLKTFNPYELLKIIKSSGGWYWVSFAFYCVVTLLVINIYKSELGLFLSVFITLYFLMVSFHVIGLTLYTRRNKLGYATVYSPEQTQHEISENKQRSYHRVATNVYSQYRQPSTIGYLKRELSNESIESYDWFLNEIMSWDIKPKFKRQFVQLYCEQLCEKDLPVKALSEYMSYLKQDAEFTIEDTATLFCLLKTAVQRNQFQVIIQISNVLLKNSNDPILYKETLVLLIKYFTENQQNDQQATKLMNHLIKKFPEMKQDKLIQEYTFVLNTP